MKKVTIIGLGWLGLPLARALIEDGIEVSATKTTSDGVAAARAIDPGDRSVRAGRRARRAAWHPPHRYRASVARSSCARSAAVAASESAQPGVADAQSLVRDGVAAGVAGVCGCSVALG